MNLLQLTQGSKQYGSKVLFDQARFSINEGEHVGVIGPNGAGKTTLFKILVGHEHLDSGEIIKSKSLKIGYLEQEAHEPEQMTGEELIQKNIMLPLWELKELGRELGLTDQHFESPLASLSGGYRMRMKLLSLIGQEPNLMLLDEPTNFLDLESILALENFLQSYKGAFLLISHDREFLRRTTDHTLEVEAGDITKFPGHIDDYFEQKAQLRTILEAQAANQENKRKSIQEFVDRFGAKATKARQAQSRLKQLEKMEKIEIKDLPVRARIQIPPPIHTGKETLNLTSCDLGYGDKIVVRDCTLRLEKGAHLGVVGYNGAGKSTLLKSLAGRLPLLKGQYQLGYQVSLSYYAQHVAEELSPTATVLDCLQMAAHPEVTRQDILNIAGSLLFSGDALEKKIKVLSGGEKSRVALGQILLKRSPLLLMDEPTNHLDFDTVEALTEALREYSGTIVVVSHDRGFIGRIATQILEIRNGRAEVYPGTYDDYVWSLERGALKAREENEQAQQKSKASPSVKSMQSQEIAPPKLNAHEEFKKYQSQVRELERKILKTEELLHQQNQKLSQLNNELLTAQGAQTTKLGQDVGLCYQEIQKLEDILMNHMETLENLQAQQTAKK
ncbi:MAG: ABC transporter ATP-binding protein [Oligoflexia bacterium]|nr:MAG: ABC transporter ATP-binding protein [Oligoflexia bacterium]